MNAHPSLKEQWQAGWSRLAGAFVTMSVPEPTPVRLTTLPRHRRPSVVQTLSPNLAWGALGWLFLLLLVAVLWIAGRAALEAAIVGGMRFPQYQPAHTLPADPHGGRV